ncbi:carboxylesterase/lipase family protein [Burkholderia cenocepacia]|uniref:carboxylesterase/lipase family protein n=1 Tax=Burkholderia cenocepacia TaxID=95486 RepID=UPI0028640E33|nr:carboxylesterase family protein [Burkholderia cenocepacia]MDR5646949.1 carboxylesterase family protein [Burkholderia cenocepacia]
MQGRQRVAVSQGVLEGTSENSVHRFFGIPYAAPPVGDLRWRSPAPPPAWAGARDASRFGPGAIQTVGATSDLRTAARSEDCLYLNIWTKSLDASERMPVMLWIHGGGFIGGAGSEDAFDGTQFARRGTVLVTINYRLGALGFLSHPSLGANFAVLDCIAALSWIRENIESFGGDASNLTIFGESAGAVLVRMLLSSPLADGLFHKAIMESGGGERAAFAPALSWERAIDASERFFDRVGTSRPDELRRLPTELIGEASHELCGVPPPPGRIHTPAHLVWVPFADGDVVAVGSDPVRRNDIPVLIGCNANEARYFLKPDAAYPAAMLAGLTGVLGGSHAEEVAAVLTRSYDGKTYEAIDALFTAAIFTEPAYECVRILEQAGRDVYYYDFRRVAPGAAVTRELAKHTAEIRYVFNNLTRDGYYDEQDQTLSDSMQSAWISFATSGVPASTRGQKWPAYRPENAQMTVIGDTIAPSTFIASELMAVLNSQRERPAI